jgi:hypothetical protein
MPQAEAVAFIDNFKLMTFVSFLEIPWYFCCNVHAASRAPVSE